MLQKEDLEAVIIAVPLWAACGRHRRLPRGGQARALRKDDGLGRRRLRADAAGVRAIDRLLEIGYQRQIQPGVSGRLRWHRPERVSSATSITRASSGTATANWRRKGDPPSPDYDPSRVGLSDVGAPAELAALLEVFQGPLRRAREPSGERVELVLRGRRPTALSRQAVFIASTTAARSTTTSTPRLTIPAAGRPPTPRSNRTRSRIATRSSSGRRRRCSSRERRKRCSSMRAASSARPASR